MTGKRIDMTQKAIVGRKVGMTQVWNEDNKIVPVTIVEVTPCRVVQIKTPDTDGYSAIQITTGQRDASKLNSPEAGHFASAGVAPGTDLMELRLDDVSEFTVGHEFGVETFEAGERVDAIGTSKGKGFAGVMKRHNFSGQRATHGAHLVHRMPGSIGQCATPSRVFKGTKMAGRMGNERVTVQGLQVVQSDPENNLVLVKGSVPGPKGGTVVIRSAVKDGSSNGSEA
ncbi:MAG: 50S ribosomal protein L3 [Acidimicrobiia bacterium]|nr:50S ribosomal protein L3 [Acidimicrobiia bacterium]